MTLLEYVEHSGESIGALARRIGLHRGHLHKIAHGQRGWTSPTAEAIEKGTNGLVTPNDLLRTLRDGATNAAPADAA